MSAGAPLGLWRPHTYQNEAALVAAGLNDGALWIINEGGMPVSAGIWPQMPGATPYPNIAARNAAGPQPEGAWCYVADIMTEFRYVRTRTVGIVVYDVFKWVFAWAYDRVKVNPMPYLQNVGDDPVRWCTVNSAIGADVPPGAGLTTRGWINDGVTGTVTDAPGDTVFTAPGPFAIGRLTFLNVVNMPDPGLIYVIMRANATLAPPGAQFPHRGMMVELGDGSRYWAFSNTYRGVLNNQNFCISSNIGGNPLCTPAGPFMAEPAWTEIHAICRVGTWVPPTVGSGGSGRQEAHNPDNGYIDIAGDCVGTLTNADALVANPFFDMMSAGNATAGAGGEMRELHAFSLG